MTAVHPLIASQNCHSGRYPQGMIMARSLALASFYSSCAAAQVKTLPEVLRGAGVRTPGGSPWYAARRKPRLIVHKKSHTPVFTWDSFLFKLPNPGVLLRSGHMNKLCDIKEQFANVLKKRLCKNS